MLSAQRRDTVTSPYQEFRTMQTGQRSYKRLWIRYDDLANGTMMVPSHSTCRNRLIRQFLSVSQRRLARRYSD
jgi:hypothetical protein